MTNLFHSFYWKISLVFLLLLIALGAAQVLITYNSSMQFVRQADQKLNLDLAKNMAGEFEAELEDGLDISRIKSSIHDMMVVNPRIEIYILDSSGKILAYFIDPPGEVKQDSVSLGPVRDFLQHPQSDLIMGEDPRNPSLTKPISVAPLDIGEPQNGYVYIILGGEQYDSALRMLENSYYLQTSIKIFGVILLVTGIAGLIIFAFLTRRLRKMTGIISKFDQGDLDQRVPVNSDDEIGRLAKSFNSMADTLQENMKELKKTDQLRRELIANVSHDLRSPLASIQGYLETILLKESTLSHEKRRKYLEIILKNTFGLRQLVEELFELSKLDTKQVEPEVEPFSISDLIQDVALKFEQQADDKGIQIVAENASGLPLVKGDIALIERVLSNLIENSIQYSEEGGIIRLELKQEGAAVQVQVKDTGAGISEDDLPHIFDRFYRAEKSRSRSEEGTGLGLAIAKKIMELHGKEIQAQNRNGQGAVFTFELDRAN
ncbi:HAMP domain-containing histidine kinase [Aliifodinibius sp. S!AR15-10]|uniref:sensor histidine kinase n=1 Tax=Aliifodinibius sp. S!AR15-10 TaxID=2950437 RepID=UPI0028560605|nr:HAMP domain-containing sensor histidine kinase [Aliifodinibius sp. S!AR15-10]MDR8391218.1 HAMP domain-containing histidine kinase [Aliifodinibius sp. S!AR15-10]